MLLTPPEILYETINLTTMKRKEFRIRVSLYLGLEAPKLVRVRAYQRVRNGKVEKVRSYYRNIEGRLVVRDELRR